MVDMTARVSSASPISGEARRSGACSWSSQWQNNASTPSWKCCATAHRDRGRRPLRRQPPDRPQLAAPLSDGRAGSSGRPVPPAPAVPPPDASRPRGHLCELGRRHPGWGQRRLAHELARVGIDPPPGLTSIYRALVGNDLIQPKARRHRKADDRRWERARPMELWQLEVMGGIWLANGRELKAVTGIDDHSRFCVAAGLVERPCPQRGSGLHPGPGPLRHP
jgi:hypothetical protein